MTAEAIKPAVQLYSEQGWEGVRKRWGSSSLESYYYEMGLSRGAIDYVAISGNRETQLHLSVLETLRSQVTGIMLVRNIIGLQMEMIYWSMQWLIIVKILN